MTGAVRRWLPASLLALVLAWVLAPAAAPLYDGPGQPDEPYRYVSPPAGARPTQPPTTARALLGVDSSGLSSPGYSNSSERGPQIVFYVPGGGLRAPAGAKQITVTETPQAPSPPLPRDGTIVTNVYRIAATTPAGDATVVGGSDIKTPTLQMRAPTSQQPGPVFEHRGPSGWTQVSTLRVGTDIYQASAPVLGDWALVQLSSRHSSGGGGVNVGLLAGGIAILAVAGIVIGIRISRSRRT